MVATLLVTGGSGTLGRYVVSRLRDGGHDVRVLSRRADGGTHQGDLATGQGVAAATRGVDAVVHAASDTRRFGRSDIVQTRTLLDLLPSQTGHVLYVSIVGIDAIPLGYYRRKRHCEELVSAAKVPSTVVRATQFHELAAMAFGAFERLPVAPIPSGFHLQPVAAREVADQVVDLIGGPPVGRADDFGGPEVLPLSAMAEAWRVHRHRPRRFVSLPLPGPAARAFRQGLNTCPAQAVGRQTWQNYLTELGPV